MRKVLLEEVAEIIAGQSPKSEHYNEIGEGVPFFQGKTDFGKDFPTVSTWCTNPKKMAKEGDILFSVRVPVGPTNFAKVDCCIGRGLAAIRANEKIDSKYLRYFFRKVERKISDSGRGSTFNSITQKDLKTLQIPLPSIEEQKAIVSKLDRAQRLIDIDKAMLEKYDQLIQSLFLDMFGDPVTNPKGWEVKPMGELMKVVRGGSPRPIKKFLGGSNPWIKIGDATKGDDIYLHETKEHIIDAGLTKTRLLPKGSLIFANCGVSLGFARVISFEGCIHDGWLAFSEFDEEKIDKIFLLKALNSVTQYFRETAPDGTQPNLNTRIMKNYEIILPPISLQRKYVKSLESIHKEKAKLLGTFKKSEELFSSLVQGVFG